MYVSSASGNGKKETNEEARSLWCSYIYMTDVGLYFLYYVLHYCFFD